MKFHKDLTTQLNKFVVGHTTMFCQGIYWYTCTYYVLKITSWSGHHHFSFICLLYIMFYLILLWI